MSFGFSAGDFIAGSNLTYRLIRALSDTQGASAEYQETILELGSIQQTFLEISQMKESRSLNRATINAASFIILSSVELIGDFLEKTKKYRSQLCAKQGSLSGSWQKMGWVLFRSDELRCLRNALQLKLSSIGVLLSTARFHGDAPSSVSQYEVKSCPSKPEETAPCRAIPITERRPPSNPDLTKESENKPATNVMDLVLFNNAGPDPMVETSVQSGSLVTNGKTQRPQATSLQLNVLEGLLQDLQAESSGAKLLREEAKRQKPIKFKDAVGRKFSFPFHLANTWEGIEDLIKQAFLHVDVLGPHVADGHYDLVGPDGEIILPQVWKTVIQPDWTITMHLWPIPENEVTPVSELTGSQPDPSVVEAPTISDKPRKERSAKKRGKGLPSPVPPSSTPGSPPSAEIPSPSKALEPIPNPIPKEILQDSPPQSIIDVQAISDKPRKNSARKREKRPRSTIPPPPIPGSPSSVRIPLSLNGPQPIPEPTPKGLLQDAPPQSVIDVQAI